MTDKPRKERVVDGQIFPTYQAACAHLQQHKSQILLNNVALDLHVIIRKESYSEATTNSARGIAEKLLALYEMKRK